MGPNPVSLDYNPYKRKLGDRHKHNTVRSCEDEGRDQGDASINQEHRRLPANYQKLGKRHAINSHSLQKEPTLMTPWSWMSSLPNCETVPVV